MGSGHDEAACQSRETIEFISAMGGKKKKEKEGNEDVCNNVGRRILHYGLINEAITISGVSVKLKRNIQADL